MLRMVDLKKLTDSLEYMFLKAIINLLRGKEITVKQAQQYAREFLKIEPFTTFDDAKLKMTQFAIKSQQFSTLTEYVNAYEKEQKVEAVINKMRQFMKNDQVEQAIQVAKQ
jgi:hypothetical protein